MRFSILTLFPEALAPYLHSSIVGRAVQRGLVSIDLVDPRSFTTDPHRKVDDTPYGGGPGMVMTCQPIEDAYLSLQPLPAKHRVLMMSASGKPFKQAMAHALSEEDQVILFCGHYEGIDARIETLIPNMEPVSVGDFVLTGGELPALTIVDAVTRLLPGVVGDPGSISEESFSNGILEYPHYTRPAEYKGLAVPEVLLSGNHKRIAEWRHEQALLRTQQFRPDLLPSLLPDLLK